MAFGDAHRFHQREQEVHKLVGRLAPSQIAAVRDLPEGILNQVAPNPAAQADDEPVTEEDR